MRLFLTFLLLISFQLNAVANDFLAGFEDIPIMKGAIQSETETFSFGNEESRYIETHVILAQNKTFSDVKNFYIETLTQLGWHEKSNDKNIISFYRENDLLEILKNAESPFKISIILKNRN